MVGAAGVTVFGVVPANVTFQEVPSVLPPNGLCKHQLSVSLRGNQGCGGADHESLGPGVCGPVPRGQARHQGHSGRCPGMWLGQQGPFHPSQPPLCLPQRSVPCKHLPHFSWLWPISSTTHNLNACAQPGSSACRSQPDLAGGPGRNQVRGLAGLTRC